MRKISGELSRGGRPVVLKNKRKQKKEESEKKRKLSLKTLSLSRASVCCCCAHTVFVGAVASDIVLVIGTQTIVEQLVVLFAVPICPNPDKQHARAIHTTPV